jgi:hypothetical protein
MITIEYDDENGESVMDVIVARIRDEEQCAEAEGALREKMRRHAHANGLREALEYVDSAFRWAAGESVTHGHGVQMRGADEIIEERLAKNKERHAEQGAS